MSPEAGLTEPPLRQAPEGASFSVVALALENAEILARFVDHYRALGAERIALYYDGPLPADLDLDAADVSVTACDAAFWADLGRAKPTVFFERQNAVYQAHAARAEGDWLLVVDADEFVFGDAPVATLLARVPAEVLSLRLPTAEAVYAPGEDIETPFASTWFRLPLAGRSARLTRLIYGDLAPYLRGGLLGHADGKQFVRLPPAPGLRIRAHDCQLDGAGVSRWSPPFAPPGARFFVGHFDAICLSRWIAKWQARAGPETRHDTMGPMRARQLDEALAAIAEGPRAARALFRRYYGLTALQLLLLRALGKAFRRPLFAQA